MRLYEIIPPFTSLTYSDNDRCVTDEDMDGYYTWGSGTKPSNLPIWIPDTQDADDSNPNIGPINENGTYESLSESPAVTWNISSLVNYMVSDNFTYPNIVVMQNGTLRVTNATMTLKQNATIRVKNGGQLIINGGHIHEANIIIENGGSLTINNGGIIQLRQNGQFLSQTGAIVHINNGKVL